MLVHVSPDMCTMQYSICMCTVHCSLFTAVQYSIPAPAPAFLRAPYTSQYAFLRAPYTSQYGATSRLLKHTCVPTLRTCLYAAQRKCHRLVKAVAKGGRMGLQTASLSGQCAHCVSMHVCVLTFKRQFVSVGFHVGGSTPAHATVS